MGRLKMADLYWLAGLLEGEGCFGVYKTNNQRAYVSLQLLSTDYDVVRRALDILAPWKNIYVQDTMHRKFPKRYKIAYSIQLCGGHAIAWMMTLHSLMMHRRQMKIRECIIKWQLHEEDKAERRLEASRARWAKHPRFSRPLSPYSID